MLFTSAMLNLVFLGYKAVLELESLMLTTVIIRYKVMAATPRYRRCDPRDCLTN